MPCSEIIDIEPSTSENSTIDNIESDDNGDERQIECDKEQDNSKFIVLDAGAIIHHMKLDTMGADFFTVKEVIDEIRDQRARDFLKNTTIDIKIREPSEEANKRVIKFASETGDLSALSVTDLKVLGLAVTIELEKNGDKFINSDPNKPKQTQKKNGPQKKKKRKKNRPKNRKQLRNNNSNSEQNDEKNTANNSEDSDDITDGNDSDSNDENNESDGEEWQTVPKKQNKKKKRNNRNLFDDGMWVTPNNIHTMNRHTSELAETNEDRTLVGCITTDYAMQNVLLRMGVRLISPDGLRIHKVKQWILRCTACFKPCLDQSKIFCPNCGNTALKKVSVQISDSGHIKYFFSKKPLPKRGAKYSIPKPKCASAKQPNRVVVSEDQLLKFKRKKQKDFDPFDPDYIFAQKKELKEGDLEILGAHKGNPNVVKVVNRKKRK